MRAALIAIENFEGWLDGMTVRQARLEREPFPGVESVPPLPVPLSLPSFLLHWLEREGVPLVMARYSTFVQVGLLILARYTSDPSYRLTVTVEETQEKVALALPPPGDWTDQLSEDAFRSAVYTYASFAERRGEDDPFPVPRASFFVP